MRVLTKGNRKIFDVKLVYVGTPESGKTTNVYEISKQWALKAMSLDTSGERTLFFDFTSKKIFQKGLNIIRISTYSVPGQKHYKPMREIILKGTDALIFVADSSEDKLQDNIDSFRDIQGIMKDTYNKELNNMSVIFQWNKQDMPNRLSPETLSRALNQHAFPEFPSIANKMVGVVESFVAAINQMFAKHHIMLSFSPEDLGFRRHSFNDQNQRRVA